MKKLKKLSALFLTVLLLLSCMTITAYAAERETQDGLSAVIETDKESYEANEPILVTVIVTNNNSFAMKNVSIESILPASLTIQNGTLKSDTVDLEAGEELTLTFTAVLEKEVPPVTEPGTSEPDTSEPDTSEPDISEPDTSEPDTTEPVVTEPDTSEPDTTEPSVTDPSQTEPSEAEPTVTEPPVTDPTTQPTTENPTAAGEVTTTEEQTTITTETPTFNAANQANGTSPVTGASAVALKVLLVVVMVAAVAFAVVMLTRKNGKKATKIISVVLSAVIGVSALATTGMIAKAEENTRSFSVDKTIAVDGEDYILNANVNYDTSWTEKTEFTETELDEMEEVETGISELLNSTNYQTWNEDNRKKAVQELLQKFVNDNLIIPNSVVYNEEYKQFYFLYNNGIEYYISIEKEIDTELLPRDDQNDMKTLQNEYDKFFNCVSKNSLNIDYDQNNCIFTYGAEGTYVPTSNVVFFNRLGLKTTYRIYPTVEDYKSILSGYDMIIIYEHGAEFFNKNKLGLSLSEKISRDKNKKYADDLSKDRIQKFNDSYCILPSFFEYYYNNGKLNNSFVQLISCQSFGRKSKLNYNFNESFTSCGAIGTLGFHNSILGEYGSEFSKYFTFSMFLVKNTKEAFDYACEEVGKDEYEFISRNLDRCSEELIKEKEKEKEKGIIAYPDITDYYSNPFSYGTFSMTIKDKEKDIPISGASSTIYWIEDDTDLCENNPYQHIEYSPSTNIDGVLSGILPIGYYKCEIKKDGYQSELLTFEITKDLQTTIDDPIYLTPFGNIAGTVKDKVTGEPISGVKVYIEEDGVVPYSCYTNENGGFELELPVGHHLIHYSHENYEHAMNGFDIEKDATTMIMEPVYLTPKNTETPVELEDPENPENPGFAGGDGTIENPYQVSTPEQLNAVRNDLDAHYIQINDIDMSAWGNWEPIGSDTNYFTGSYNGNHMSITNFYMSPAPDETKRCWGLFATVSGKIYDLEISSGAITTQEIDRGLYGCYVGSIAGEIIYNGEISNCNNYCDIELLNKIPSSATGSTHATCAGGIVAYGANQFSINNCRNYGAIKGSSTMGGIIASGHNGEISSCINYGNISNNIYNLFYSENGGNSWLEFMRYSRLF